MGPMKLSTARNLLKIDVNKTRKIYDFLADEGLITKDMVARGTGLSVDSAINVWDIVGVVLYGIGTYRCVHILEYKIWGGGGVNKRYGG